MAVLIFFSITGSATYYGWGGAGGVQNEGSNTWGVGGGGNPGASGAPNTGGGGGGGGVTSGNASNAGSGVVILRYAGAQRATGGSVSSSGGYTIHKFASSGTFTPTN